MRWVIPVATVAVLAAAASLLGRAATAREYAVASDRLPTLGTVGDLPPEAERLVVEVDAKGRVTVEGKSVDLAALRDILARAADASREEEQPRASKLHVVIRADRDLPWQGAQWMMQECADPKLRIYRILFAARPEDGGEEGAVAAFLPKDVGLSAWPPGAAAPPAKVSVKLGLASDGNDAAPGDMAPRLLAFLDRDPKLLGEIDGAPRVPTGTVLRTLDVLLRSGVKDVVFRGTSLLKGAGIEEALATTAAAEGKLGIFVLDTLIPRPEKPVAMKPVPRVKGGLAGVTAPPAVGPLTEVVLGEPPAAPPK